MQNHPGFECYAPVDVWDQVDDDTWERHRPRVMTYIRKGTGLRTQQRRPIKSRDLLWNEVNGFSILNVYRSPQTPEALDYVTNLAAGEKTLVGGDFNVRHEMFEPGSRSFYGGDLLAQWTTLSGMDFIGAPGVATHNTGHVLDLTFSNIPFAVTHIREDLYSGSDHETQVTVLPSRGQVPLDQFHYRIPDEELGTFVALVRSGVALLPALDPRATCEDLDLYIKLLTEGFQSALETVGKPDRGGGIPAPWWTTECDEAYKLHRQARTNLRQRCATLETRTFLATVRRAKREYWRQLLDGVTDDKALYKVVGWHKLTSNLKAPPLEVNGVRVEDTEEKAEALRREVLDRFSASDDLHNDPLENWSGTGHLPWEKTVSVEEVELSTISTASTSPETDRVTVRLLKACWNDIKGILYAIYSRCLVLSYFPTAWKLVEVAILPKVGKKDRTSVCSWRPIALLSCIGKGLERIIARRIAWAALTNQVLSPQHGGALPKRSAMDLVASFTHDVEAAFAKGRQVTMITMDVQGAFDALLPRRLLARITLQGWPLTLLKLIQGFLSDRQVRVRLEKTITPSSTVACGTPQGSPLSPVLYMLYLAELLNQDHRLRFGYADDICLYRATKSLDLNVQLLAADVRRIKQWGQENKVAFAPEKLEMIHLTRRRGGYSPWCIVDDELAIQPITTAEKDGEQPAIRWLGVWFDRKLSFKRHITERAAKARKVANHIRGLARIKDGPPAAVLRKAVVTCVLPSILYGTEAWYAGRYRPSRAGGFLKNKMVSAGNGWHIDIVDKVLAQAARGVLPIWRTTLLVTLYRDAGLPSGPVALEQAKARFAFRLRIVDPQHPLAKRAESVCIDQRHRTRVQRLGQLIPAAPRPQLAPPYFSPGSRENPTTGKTKEEAAKAFKLWWATLPATDITVFSDGSEKTVDGEHKVGYGFAVYQGTQQIGTGYGALNPLSHVFGAEAVGAWRALQYTLRLPLQFSSQRIWMCIDSTSVILYIRGEAAASSQWAFLHCQEAMDTRDIQVRWSPGHTGILGNEAADTLADLGADHTAVTGDLAAEPTISGLRSVMHDLYLHAQEA
jgi:ribonuclease HI